MATQEEDKKTLVVPEAGDATEPKKDVQDYSKPDNQVGAGGGGDEPPTDDTPTINYDQLRLIQNAPSDMSMHDIAKSLGVNKTEPKLNQGAINSGVLAGAPSEVVIQHMLDQLPPMETKEQRERRERRERINKTFAALGDGFSSLANIYYATKGAPAAEGKTLSAGETERQEKARKERESAVDRRIRLLKEQLAERHRQEELKLQKELNEAKTNWYNSQGEAKLTDAETNKTTKTIVANAKKSRVENQNENEDKLTNAKVDELGTRSDKNVAQGQAATKNASTNAAKVGEQKRHNQENERQGRERNQETQRHHQETENNQRNGQNKTGGNSYTNTKKLGL